MERFCVMVRFIALLRPPLEQRRTHARYFASLYILRVEHYTLCAPYLRRLPH